MARRWGLGPVYAIEWRVAARRWQTYATRSCFVAMLLVPFFIVWQVEVGRRTSMGRNDMARAGENFFYGIVGTQLALLLLAAPAATAGAICLDKARGSLLHLLVTDLSDAEIVLGKLAARLAPVLGLLLAGLPVLATAILLGGIVPEAVFGSFLVSIGVVVFCTALALALSVWANKTHEVLLITYLFEALMLMAPLLWQIVEMAMSGFRARPSVPDWLLFSNPFWLAFAPYSSPGRTDLGDPVWFLAGATVLATALTLLSIVCVRRVAVRQSGQSARPRRVWFRRPFPRLRLPGPSLDGNPVLWREWHRRRPSRWMQVTWLLFTLGAVGLTGLSLMLALFRSDPRDLASIVNAFIVSLGLLLFCVTAVTSLAEERVRGSLDVLLTTPLSTASVVWGKWWGTYRTIPMLALLPTLTIVVQALLHGSWPLACLIVGLIFAYGAALTSLGLALATWVPRLGRAIACSMTAYVFMTVAWLFIARLFEGRNDRFEFLAVGSPFWGVGALTDYLRHSGGPHGWEQHMEAATFWIVVYLVVAAVLQVATLLTFDRCLGRIRQKRRVQRAA